MVKSTLFAGLLGAVTLGVLAFVVVTAMGIVGGTNFHGPPPWLIGGVYGVIGAPLGFVLGVIGGLVTGAFRGRS